MRNSLIFAIAMLVLLSLACSSSQVEPTPTLFVIPTFTAEPTLTPTQTATPTLAPPEIPQDVSNYLQGVSSLILVHVSGLQQLKNANEIMADNVTVIFDPTWQGSTIVALATIRYVHTRMLAIVPPADMTEIHASLLQATDSCKEATESYAQGIDNIDADQLHEAANYLFACNSKLETVSDLVDEYNSKQGTAFQADIDLVEVEAYLHQRAIILEVAQKVKNDFDTIFGQFIEGKVSGEDSSWQTTSERILTRFEAVMEAYKSLNVPTPFANSAEKTISALSNCSTGFDVLLTAVRTNDQQGYESGIPYIGLCNSEWLESNQMTRSDMSNFELYYEFEFVGPAP
jgi:hypothetical protein